MPRSRITFVALTVALVGCGSSSTSSSTSTPSSSSTPSTAATPQKAQPKKGTLAALVSCARSAGYQVEKRDPNLVRVTKPGGGFVNVEQMASHAEAEKAAKAADLIQSRVVGRLWMKSYPATDGGLRTDIETCVLTGSPN